MGGIVDAVFGGGDDGGDAADATEHAADVQYKAQKEALDYLKEINKLPQQYKEGALSNLAGIYGLEGGTGSQQDLIDRARTSPLYGAIMGGQEAGEEAILRNAAATGGLRSGNIQSNLYDYNTQLANKALLESYNQQLGGLQGLTGLATNEASIAQNMAGMGQTLAQGITGSAQARQNASQNQTSNIMGLANMAMDIYGMF
jgi:hypothetical protein